MRGIQPQLKSTIMRSCCWYWLIGDYSLSEIRIKLVQPWISGEKHPQKLTIGQPFRPTIYGDFPSVENDYILISPESREATRDISKERKQSNYFLPLSFTIPSQTSGPKWRPWRHNRTWRTCRHDRTLAATDVTWKPDVAVILPFCSGFVLSYNSDAPSSLKPRRNKMLDLNSCTAWRLYAYTSSERHVAWAKFKDWTPVENRHVLPFSGILVVIL